MSGSYLTASDFFCGCGGSTEGLEKAGVVVREASNHWDRAIETHGANFPHVNHRRADISGANPRTYPTTDLGWFSPECFPAESLVLTAAGFKPISTILVGDEVLTHLGRWRRVVRVQSGIGNTIVVAGQGHSFGIEVTPNHRFYARTQESKWNNAKRDYNRKITGSAGWVAAKQLVGCQKRLRYRWATPCSMERLPSAAIPAIFGKGLNAWWLIGRWIGDGSLSFGRNSEVVISCGKTEEHELSQVLLALGWKAHIKRTAINFTIGDRAARDWLLLHFGRGAATKSLPGWVFGLMASLREQLLAGYISADGHIDDRRTSACSVSKALALSIRLLAEGVGFRTSFQGCAQHSTSIEGRELGNCLPLWTVSWESNGSEREAFWDGTHSWSLVKKFKPGRSSVRVFNLEVEEDHSYIVEGIVVKNCTSHSLAQGKKRKDAAQLSLLPSGKPDPSSERSRATMWDVVRFSEVHRYRIVIVENVVEVTLWELWSPWLAAMHALGYKHKVVSLNSMHVGAPQSRDRVYIVFWRNGDHAPDLDPRPPAWCLKCDAQVEARQAWKPNRSIGRYGGASGKKGQYVYACPACGSKVEPYYVPALAAIDWTIPATRIGDRETLGKKPLKPRTLDRVLYGLENYGRVPIVIETLYGDRSGIRTGTPIMLPLPTQTARQSMALAGMTSFMVTLRGTSPGHIGAAPLTDPVGTVSAGGNHHAVLSGQPFLCPAGSLEAHPTSAFSPVPTLTTSDRFAVVHGSAVLCMRDTPDMPISEMSDPWPTQCTAPQIVAIQRQPYLVSYYGTAQASSIADATPTVTTLDRHALCEPGSETDLDVNDLYFRMFAPPEIKAAMAFPATYIVTGNQREQVKQLGNAITPPAGTWIIRRCVESLHPELRQS